MHPMLTDMAFAHLTLTIFVEPHPYAFTVADTTGDYDLYPVA